MNIFRPLLKVTWETPSFAITNAKTFCQMINAFSVIMTEVLMWQAARKALHTEHIYQTYSCAFRNLCLYEVSRLKVRKVHKHIKVLRGESCLCIEKLETRTDLLDINTRVSTYYAFYIIVCKLCVHATAAAFNPHCMPTPKLCEYKSYQSCS